jgi:D-3-phosphoglycerate dehydrogenase
MLNKSKGEIAYTLVDVDSAATPDLVAELGRIGGVLCVRYLPLQD